MCMISARISRFGSIVSRSPLIVVTKDFPVTFLRFLRNSDGAAMNCLSGFIGDLNALRIMVLSSTCLNDGDEF